MSEIRIGHNEAQQLHALLTAAGDVVIVTHEAPDGDAVGASTALCRLLRRRGRKATVVVPDAIAPRLKSVPGADDAIDARHSPEQAKALIGSATLIVCLDFNELRRTGALADIIGASKATRILIDHHLHPAIEAAAIVSRPEYSSTCLLLFTVLMTIGLADEIDSVCAESLMTGILTDTGNLSYNSSDPALYVAVAELLKLGADKDRIVREQFTTHSENCLRLNAYAIDRKMEVFLPQGAALITLTRAELNSRHYVKGDTEGLVNRPLEIPGVRYSCFLREEDGYVKVSMRSVGDFPVNEVCRDHFGGGGHLNAAGGEFPGTLEQAACKFRSLLDENARKYPVKEEKK